ncbi:hypothetical protein [Natronosalvus rutilus]|uniref:Uncharacterized protein n=1 Tax=Natronosalvus rutilus TaxID=2953753 RepID=A0A9E7NBZ2_9EURY|nr:hypothetical protein [Natronosalvus rutilus]UTF55649.1 hypothetical protein NGM29_19835 [Natronosalvus rutilus]
MLSCEWRDCDRTSDYRFNVKNRRRVTQRVEYFCERHALERIEEANRDAWLEIMSSTKR